MSNASEDQLARLQGTMEELKSSYEQFEVLEEVDKRLLLHMIMCIHQCLEVVEEIVKPEWH